MADPGDLLERALPVRLNRDDLVRLGAINIGLQQFLAAAVRARKQIIVAGTLRTDLIMMFRKGDSGFARIRSRIDRTPTSSPRRNR